MLRLQKEVSLFNAAKNNHEFGMRMNLYYHSWLFDSPFPSPIANHHKLKGSAWSTSK
jgi:hypothetical protein